MGGYVLGLLGFTTHAIARRLDNRYLNDFLLHASASGRASESSYKNGDFERIQAVLAGGGVIATLGDQDAGQRGLFVDFFGRPASTHKAVALLALEYNVPMVVIGVPRVGEPMRYQIVAEDVILPEEYAGRPDAVRGDHAAVHGGAGAAWSRRRRSNTSGCTAAGNTSRRCGRRKRAA